MAQDRLQAFFELANPRRSVSEVLDTEDPANPRPDSMEVLTGQRQVANPVPNTTGDVFRAGVQSGAESLGADIEYFRALFNTVTGDAEEAADSIASARMREDFASIPLDGVETFEEFLAEPTFEGFITQAAKGTGQVVPSAALSIASAGTGALAAIAGRGVLNQVNKEVAKRIIKDSVERSAKGVADPTEKEIAQLAYGTLRQAATRGGIAGAFGAEYAPMAGSNLSEALESGQELDTGTALRAGGVALPQAAIGVGSEYALLKLIGTQAAKRAATEGSLFANFAKRVGSGSLAGGAIEGTTEVVQEGISVANRADLDPTFTAEEAKLRLAESAFAGFFGGAAPGAAGGAIGGTLDAASRAPDGVKNAGQGALDRVAGVVDKARRLLDSASAQRVNRQINNEQFGDIFSGNTTPEPESDINAQLRAMVDSSSGKNSVWIAGEASKVNARTNRATEIVVDGNEAFAAFIPGRGTIVSTDRRIVDEVIAARASDQALQIALGYSAVKDAANPGDQVVQVFDRDGRVISEEATTDEGLPAAFEAARKLMPRGGSVSQTTVEKALEDRKRRFEAERPVEIRDVELFEALPPDQQEELRRMQDQPRDEQVDETDPNESEVDEFGQGIQAVEGQRTIVGAYGRKKDPSAIFDNTAAARANFESVFGETNWSDPRFAAMNERMLNAAANEQRSTPDSAVYIEDMPDGSFQLVREDFGDLFRFVDNKEGTDVKLNINGFIKAAVRKAKRHGFARGSRVTVVGPDGKKAAVNLVDLTRSGQRLVQTRNKTGYEMAATRGRKELTVAPEAAAAAGLNEILAELIVGGYDVQIDGQSLLGLTDGRIPEKLGSVPAAIVNGRKQSLNWMLRPPRFRQQTQEERETTMLQEQALSERPDEVADGQPETDRMAESSVRGDELRTQMNIDTDRSAINRSAGPTTSSGFDPTKVTPEQLDEMSEIASLVALKGMVENIIRDLLSTLQLAVDPSIYSHEKLKGLSSSQLATLFPNPELRGYVEKALKDLDGGSIFGRHISGPFGKVIILRESGNVLQDAIVAAHEIGHSLYKEERDKALTNKALRQRLLKAYQNSPAFKGLKDKYGFEVGFEEWFSDQVALWANKRYKNRQPKTMSEKFFKDFAARLKKLWQALSDNFRKRYSGGVTQDFEQFMDAVLQSRRTQTRSNGIGFVQKAFIYELNDMAIAAGGEALANRWRNNIRRALKNPKVRGLLNLVRTADGVLRSYAGNEIADMFYVRSQQTGSNGRIGMVGQRNLELTRLVEKFRKEIGTLGSPEVNAAMEEAATSIPTDQLTNPMARQIRQFLVELYDDYIVPSKTKIGRQDNFFPVVISLAGVEANPQRFIDILVAQRPTSSRQAITEAVSGLVDLQRDIQNAPDIHVDPLNPARGAKEAIELTKGVDREAIQEFLLPPTDAFYKYLRQVTKRVEFDRATLDADGNSRLKVLLDQLPPEDRAKTEEIINLYLGYRSAPLSPFMRALNSWGQLLQFVTILPFATISSLTDIAGPIINSKEFGGITEAFKQIAASIQNPREAQQLARDIGVVSGETVANVWVSEAEQDYMDPTARKISDWWFNLIGLNWFTRFSREFAAGMGVRFIEKHARNEFNNPRSDRYLEQLGLTRQDVMTWMANGRQLSTPEGQKVKQALQRFVESSILRPNAAERPMWASDPHWALVWQLKAYFYSFGKVIIGGIKREADDRIMLDQGTPGGTMAATAMALALPIAALLPLAMLGMELREYAKNGLAWLLPGIEADAKYFRTDRMDWPEYLGEAFERTGLLGPLAIVAGMNQSSEWGDSPLFTLLGPTAETLETAFDNGFRVDRTIKDRLFPVYNQL